MLLDVLLANNLIVLVALAAIGVMMLRLSGRALITLTQISAAERQNTRKLASINDEIERLRRGR